MVSLLFCDLFLHANEEEHMDSIRFKRPVILSALRILPNPQVSAHSEIPSIRFKGITNPTAFSLEVFARDYASKSDVFKRIEPVFEYDERKDTCCNFQSMVTTTHVVIRGKYQAISLCLYGQAIQGPEQPPAAPHLPLPAPILPLPVIPTHLMPQRPLMLQPQPQMQPQLRFQPQQQQQQQQSSRGGRSSDELAMPGLVGRSTSQQYETQTASQPPPTMAKHELPAPSEPIIPGLGLTRSAEPPAPERSRTEPEPPAEVKQEKRDPRLILTSQRRDRDRHGQHQQQHQSPPLPPARTEFPGDISPMLSNTSRDSKQDEGAEPKLKPEEDLAMGEPDYSDFAESGSEGEREEEEDSEGENGRYSEDGSSEYSGAQSAASDEEELDALEHAPTAPEPHANFASELEFDPLGPSEEHSPPTVLHQHSVDPFSRLFVDESNPLGFVGGVCGVGAPAEDDFVATEGHLSQLLEDLEGAVPHIARSVDGAVYCIGLFSRLSAADYRRTQPPPQEEVEDEMTVMAESKCQPPPPPPRERELVLRAARCACQVVVGTDRPDCTHVRTCLVLLSHLLMIGGDYVPHELANCGLVDHLCRLLEARSVSTSSVTRRKAAEFLLMAVQHPPLAEAVLGRWGTDINNKPTPYQRMLRLLTRYPNGDDEGEEGTCVSTYRVEQHLLALVRRARFYEAVSNFQKAAESLVKAFPPYSDSTAGDASALLCSSSIFGPLDVPRSRKFAAMLKPVSSSLKLMSSLLSEEKELDEPLSARDLVAQDHLSAPTPAATATATPTVGPTPSGSLVGGNVSLFGMPHPGQRFRTLVGRSAPSAAAKPGQAQQAQTQQLAQRQNADVFLPLFSARFHFTRILDAHAFLPLLSAMLGYLFSLSAAPDRDRDGDHSDGWQAAVAEQTSALFDQCRAILLHLLRTRQGCLHLAHQPSFIPLVRTLVSAPPAWLGAQPTPDDIAVCDDLPPLSWVLEAPCHEQLVTPQHLGHLVAHATHSLRNIDRLLSSAEGSDDRVFLLHRLQCMSHRVMGRESLVASLTNSEPAHFLLSLLFSQAGGDGSSHAQRSSHPLFAAQLLLCALQYEGGSAFLLKFGSATHAVAERLATHAIPSDLRSRLSQITAWTEPSSVLCSKGVAGLMDFVKERMAACKGVQPPDSHMHGEEAGTDSQQQQSQQPTDQTSPMTETTDTSASQPTPAPKTTITRATLPQLTSSLRLLSALLEHDDKIVPQLFKAGLLSTLVDVTSSVAAALSPDRLEEDGRSSAFDIFRKERGQLAILVAALRLAHQMLARIKRAGVSPFCHITLVRTVSETFCVLGAQPSLGQPVLGHPSSGRALLVDQARRSCGAILAMWCHPDWAFNIVGKSQHPLPVILDQSGASPRHLFATAVLLSDLFAATLSPDTTTQIAIKEGTAGGDCDAVKQAAVCWRDACEYESRLGQMAAMLVSSSCVAMHQQLCRLACAAVRLGPAIADQVVGPILQEITTPYSQKSMHRALRTLCGVLTDAAARAYLLGSKDLAKLLAQFLAPPHQQQQDCSPATQVLVLRALRRATSMAETGLAEQLLLRVHSEMCDTLKQVMPHALKMADVSDTCLQLELASLFADLSAQPFGAFWICFNEAPSEGKMAPALQALHSLTSACVTQLREDACHLSSSGGPSSSEAAPTVPLTADSLQNLKPPEQQPPRGSEPPSPTSLVAERSAQCVEACGAVHRTLCALRAFLLRERDGELGSKKRTTREDVEESAAMMMATDGGEGCDSSGKEELGALSATAGKSLRDIHSALASLQSVSPALLDSLQTSMSSQISLLNGEVARLGSRPAPPVPPLLRQEQGDEDERPVLSMASVESAVDAEFPALPATRSVIDEVFEDSAAIDLVEFVPSLAAEQEEQKAMGSGASAQHKDKHDKKKAHQNPRNGGASYTRNSFRNRRPNTSRPPSIHVDDFMKSGQTKPQQPVPGTVFPVPPVPPPRPSHRHHPYAHPQGPIQPPAPRSGSLMGSAIGGSRGKYGANYAPPPAPSGRSQFGPPPQGQYRGGPQQGGMLPPPPFDRQMMGAFRGPPPPLFPPPPPGFDRRGSSSGHPRDRQQR